MPSASASRPAAMEVVLGPDGSVTFRVLGDKAATAPLDQVAQGGEPIARNRRLHGVEQRDDKLFRQ